MSGEVSPRVSFAQNGEDIRLLRVLEPVEHGFFVDIGAADPVLGSVTNLFALRGWRGVNVEPGPLFDELVIQRPNDVNLNCVVGREHSTVPFHITYPDLGMSTTDLAFHEARAAHIEHHDTVQREQRPLRDILSRHASERVIHFLKVDVEGSEADVLASNDWTRFRPWIVVVEAVASWSRRSTHDAWEPDLLDHGYVSAGFDGINRFYVALEHEQHAATLAYPVSALDHYITAGYAALTERLAQAEALKELAEAAAGEAETAAIQAESLAREAVAARRTSVDRLTRELAAAVELTRIADLERDESEARAASQAALVEAMIRTRVWRTGTKLRKVASPAKRALRPVRKLRLGLPRSRRRRTSSDVDATSQANSGDASPKGPSSLPVPATSSSTELRSIIELLPRPIRLFNRSETARLLAGAHRLTYLSADDAQHKTLPPNVRRVLNELQLACALRLGEEYNWYPPSRGYPGQSADVVVDVRCLQDPLYTHRGVGFHAKTTLGILRQTAPDLRIAGLLDPTLPDLNAESREFLDFAVYSPGHVQIHTTRLFVCLSPLTAALGPAVPFLRSPDTQTLALIYDFIPAELPGRYLNDAESALRYHSRLNILGEFDCALAISEATARVARDLLGWDEQRIQVTGVVDHLPAAERLAHSSRERRFVIAPTGGDERKNLRGAVAAFGRAFGGTPDMDLHIIGSLPAGWEATFVALAKAHGVGPQRLLFRSQLSDKELAQEYCDAEAAIIPSLAEGFSIPVVEAVRRRCPVVASDIPAHQELLGDGWWLAAPDDASGLAAALVRAVRNRRDTSEIQRATVERRYSPTRVAELTASAFNELLVEPVLGTPHQQRRPRTRPRIAVISPLPSQASGIADYTANTLCGLSEFADIVFVPSVRDPVSLESGGVERFRYDRLLPGRFDRIITVMGNSHFHVSALDYLEQLGSAVIGHDTRMAEFYTTFDEGPTAKRVLGIAGDTTPDQMHAYMTELDSMPGSGYCDIARLASPLILHSTRLSGRVFAETGVSATVVPFVPFNVPGRAMTVDDHLRARRRLGLNEHLTHIVGFGGVDVRTKAVDIVIRALGWLESWGDNYLFHIVGELPRHERVELERVIIELGLHQRVQFSGRSPRREAYDYMVGADMAVQLRTASVLSLSGALADAIAYGIPTLAAAPLALDHDAPFYIRGVPTSVTPILVAEGLNELRGLRRARFDEIEEARLQYLARYNTSCYARKVGAALGLV